MPKTLAGQKDSSPPPKPAAGAPPSCCKHQHISTNTVIRCLMLVLNFRLHNERVRLFAVRDSADRVVGENGRYEELIACSHEIAASTAQLVAASKVQTKLLL